MLNSNGENSIWTEYLVSCILAGLTLSRSLYESVPSLLEFVSSLLEFVPSLPEFALFEFVPSLPEFALFEFVPSLPEFALFEFVPSLPEFALFEFASSLPEFAPSFFESVSSLFEFFFSLLEFLPSVQRCALHKISGFQTTNDHGAPASRDRRPCCDTSRHRTHNSRRLCTRPHRYALQRRRLRSQITSTRTFRKTP
ncbi:hypothetical protein BC629DRAFT_514254 [Irpex lacteus]|nr:hypothetical protein BC629DRAFT_514254 [Irpex lacteus]